MRDAAFPVILIMLGLAWLLKSLDWLPDIQWLWIIGLSGAGVAILLLEGITKSSVVSGPLLILAGFMTYFHQHHGLGWRYIVPIALITTGILMLVARMPSVPVSRPPRRRNSIPQDPGNHHG